MDWEILLSVGDQERKTASVTSTRPKKLLGEIWRATLVPTGYASTMVDAFSDVLGTDVESKVCSNCGEK
jgi:hypothetical protein